MQRQRATVGKSERTSRGEEKTENLRIIKRTCGQETLACRQRHIKVCAKMIFMKGKLGKCGVEAYAG